LKWLEALFGQARVPKSRLEQLLALSTAHEMDALLQIAMQESGTRPRRQRDQYGFQWLILEDQQLEDLVAVAHQVGLTFQEHGFAERLLSAVFGFQGPDGQRVFWVYNYKRGNFYPFAPLPGRKTRDNHLELRLAAVMRGEMPIEPEQERWYPLWDAPV